MPSSQLHFSIKASFLLAFHMERPSPMQSQRQSIKRESEHRTYLIFQYTVSTWYSLQPSVLTSMQQQQHLIVFILLRKS